ncbi:hypothetical protein ES703_119394 [subsurface metagenome]
MVSECFISVRDVQQFKLTDGYRIVAVTDIPCHLWMRWSTVKPQRHSQPVLKRGLYLHADVYLCFVAYHDNEQEEAGDTLIHTFIKRNWPHCETRYFHFWGTVAGNPCRSTTALFKKHFTAPPTYDYLPLYHNRYLYSNHGTWATARAGFNPRKDGNYQRPNNLLIVRTQIIATWHIIRSYLNFDSQTLPAGKSVMAGSLGLYVINVPGIGGTLHITRGLWDEPVTAGDWALQTAEVTSLGEIAQNALVVGQYNWIDLNQDGIDWVNQKAVEPNQYESYDWRKNAYGEIYGSNQWSQSFTPLTAHTLTSLKLRLARVGDPGDVLVEIWNTTPGDCPKDTLLSQKMVPGIFLSTAVWGDWCQVDLPTPVPLLAGVAYAIRVRALGGTSTKKVRWIGASGSPYPNGKSCYTDNGGTSWTSYDNFDWYFIEYESATTGGTKFVLRASPDLSGVEPPPAYHQEAHFYSAQKGTGKYPLLKLTLD